MDKITNVGAKSMMRGSAHGLATALGLEVVAELCDFTSSLCEDLGKTLTSFNTVFRPTEILFLSFAGTDYCVCFPAALGYFIFVSLMYGTCRLQERRKSSCPLTSLFTLLDELFVAPTDAGPLNKAHSFRSVHGGRLNTRGMCLPDV